MGDSAVMNLLKWDAQSQGTAFGRQAVYMKWDEVFSVN